MISRRLVLGLAAAALTITLGSGLPGTASAADSAAAAASVPVVYPQVRVLTNMGSFVSELNPARAPITVATFLGYVKEGQYTQTLMHRVIAGFLVQGGGFTVAGAPKATHPSIPNESGNGLQNKRGTVGLARTAQPHSGTCQFYINVADNPELDPLPVRWGYAVFGRVIEGMDVVDAISIVPTGAVGIFKTDAPLSPVIIEKVELLSSGSTKQQSPAPEPLAPAPNGSDVQSPN